MILAVLMTVSLKPLCAADVSKADVEAVEKQAEARRMEHKKLQAQAVQLSLELAKINEKMIKAAAQLQGDEEKTTQMEAELETLERRLAEAKEKFKKENSSLIQTLAALQNLALHPNQALLAQPLEPEDMVRSALLLRQTVPYLSKRAEKIAADLKLIDEEQKKVLAQLGKIQDKKDSIQKQQNAMKEMSRQKAQMRQQVEGQSQKTKKEAEKLASEAADLRDLWEKIEHERELKRRRDEEIRRAARAREEKTRKAYLEEQRRLKNQNNNLISEDNDVIKSKGTGFANARGKLVRPARGNILTAYGEELSKGVSSKGIVIGTRNAAQVIAPYDGTVVFSGPFKGYGNLIIIDHGKGYMSLLAGMSALQAESGQLVLAGEPVGIMPESGKTRLYVEIRQNKRPINPAPWFAN